MNSRGTSVAQIILFITGETILIAIVCSLAGPFLAIGIIKFAGVLPWLAEFAQNQTLYINLSTSAFIASGIGGFVSLITVLIPAVLFIKNRASTFKRNERPKDSIIQKYYLQKAKGVYTTHISESAVYAAVLGKRIEPIDIWNNITMGSFACINNHLYTHQDNI